MNNIAKFRKLRGLRQEDLAEIVGVQQPHISRIERGDEGPPLAIFREIAKALDVDLVELFTDERTNSELALLSAFRNLPEDRKRGWLDMARTVVSESTVTATETDSTHSRSLTE